MLSTALLPHWKREEGEEEGREEKRDGKEGEKRGEGREEWEDWEPCAMKLLMQ